MVKKKKGTVKFEQAILAQQLREKRARASALREAERVKKQGKRADKTAKKVVTADELWDIINKGDKEFKFGFEWLRALFSIIESLGNFNKALSASIDVTVARVLGTAAGMVVDPLVEKARDKFDSVVNAAKEIAGLNKEEQLPDLTYYMSVNANGGLDVQTIRTKDDKPISEQAQEIFKATVTGWLADKGYKKQQPGGNYVNNGVPLDQTKFTALMQDFERDCLKPGFDMWQQMQETKKNPSLSPRPSGL